jgi:phosphonate transport system substrate-binding protein
MTRSSNRVVFGIVPTHDDQASRALLGDWCDILGRAVDATVVPFRAPSPEALAQGIGAGRIQIAWLSPTLLATSVELEGAAPLVSSVRQGVAAYHAALFCDAARSFTSLRDLRGKRAAWVAKSSSSGYIFPRIGLARSGLDPTKLFGAELFLDSHGAVVAAVFEGRADVGATFAVYKDSDASRPLLRAPFVDGHPPGKARVLLASGPIPADVIAAAPPVPTALRSKLRTALMALAGDPAARPILAGIFGIDGFEVFTDGSHRRLKALLASGAQRGLLTGG